MYIIIRIILRQILSETDKLIADHINYSDNIMKQLDIGGHFYKASLHKSLPF